MTAAEITAAHDSVLSAFPMITSLMAGNIGVVFAILTGVAICGIVFFILRGLYSAVGIRF